MRHQIILAREAEDAAELKRQEEEDLLKQIEAEKQYDAEEAAAGRPPNPCVKDEERPQPKAEIWDAEERKKIELEEKKKKLKEKMKERKEREKMERSGSMSSGSGGGRGRCRAEGREEEWESGRSVGEKRGAGATTPIINRHGSGVGISTITAQRARGGGGGGLGCT